MSSSAAFLFWGGLMAALTAVGAAIFVFPDAESPALLGGTAVLFVLLAALLAFTRLGTNQAIGTRAAPDLSPATVWLALSLVLLALSTELGLWLALIAGGMVLVGIGALIRELLAEREAYRQAGGRGTPPPPAGRRAGRKEQP